ncbi:hypothetical protein IAT38_006218 [Cryptococcus sp. DSM 104549]
MVQHVSVKTNLLSSALIERRRKVTKAPSPLRKVAYSRNRDRELTPTPSPTPSSSPSPSPSPSGPSRLTKSSSIDDLIVAASHVQHAYAGGSLTSGLDLLADLALGTGEYRKVAEQSSVAGAEQAEQEQVVSKVMIKISAQAVARASTSPSPPRIKLILH